MQTKHLPGGTLFISYTAEFSFFTRCYLNHWYHTGCTKAQENPGLPFDPGLQHRISLEYILNSVGRARFISIDKCIHLRVRSIHKRMWVWTKWEGLGTACLISPCLCEMAFFFSWILFKHSTKQYSRMSLSCVVYIIHSEPSKNEVPQSIKLWQSAEPRPLSLSQKRRRPPILHSLINPASF